MTSLKDIVNNLDANIDATSQLLTSNTLPLTGGSMSGDIKFNTGAISQKNSPNEIILFGTGDGVVSASKPCIAIRNEKHESDPGSFYIRACYENQSGILRMRPNGEMLWNGSNVLRSINGFGGDASGNVDIQSVKIINKHNTHLNQITQQGRYTITNDSSGVANYGYPVMNWGIVDVDVLQNYTIQRYYADNDSLVFTRYLNTGNSTDTNLPLNSWSSWHQQVNLASSYKNGANWYRVYSDGWKEQGGPMSTSGTVTLHVAMSDNSYYVDVTWNGGKSSTFYPADWVIHSLTTTSFFTSATTNGGNVRGSHWYVCGY